MKECRITGEPTRQMATSLDLDASKKTAAIVGKVQKKSKRLSGVTRLWYGHNERTTDLSSRLALIQCKHTSQSS